VIQQGRFLDKLQGSLSKGEVMEMVQKISLFHDIYIFETNSRLSVFVSLCLVGEIWC
jgi:hypothetical protein